MTKTRTKKCFLLGVLLLWSLFLRAQDYIQFKNYTINDGLSQSSVSSIVQDQLGALWLGTQDGINRFNGKNIEVFSSDKGYDISNEYINTSFIDNNGNIWFGTYDGLTKYDPKLVRFTAYKLSSHKQINISSIAEEASSGKLWIGTTFGQLFSFNPQTEKFHLIDNQTFNSEVIKIKCKDNQVTFVSQYDGILQTDSTFQHKEWIKPIDNKQRELQINCLIHSPKHQLVVSTDKGVFYYWKAKNRFYPADGLIAKLKNVNIIDVLYLSKTRLFVASKNSGLYQLRSTNDSVTITNYSANVFQKGSLASNRLTGIFKDKQGAIWVTSDRGLSSFNPNFIGFKGVGVSINPKKGLTSQNVWGFAESKDNRYLYIATDRGVSRFDHELHIFTHYYRSKKEGNDDHTTLSLQFIDDNTLLVGGIDGLFELKIDEEDPDNYSYKKFKHSNIENRQRGFDGVYKIIPYTTAGEFLIGTRGGVELFNYPKETFTLLYNQPHHKHTIGPGACRFVFQEDSNFYAAPASGGIYQIKLKDDMLKAYKNNPFTILSKASSSYFSDVLRTDKSTFWFATMGGGVFKYNMTTHSVTQLDKSNGLPNNVIYGIEAARKNPNYIWLSTNKGVVAYRINDKKFYVFTSKDGLMSNELNQGASFVDQAGNIYFGGIQGYNFVNPSEAFYTNDNLTVYFSGIKIENKPVFPEKGGILTQSIAFTHKINLPYTKRSLKLRFFANDLTNPDRIEYKYVMKGSDNVEETLGSHNDLRLTSLAPGTYDLYIYARVTNGEWNSHPAHLTIVVQHPYWMTWWFYTIIVVFIALISLYRVRKGIDESRRRQIRLEMKIATRTRELRKKNEQIEKQKQEIEREKEKSERILNNVLPKDTASQLKKEGQATARDFEKVSILFTDFVGFSKQAENMPAKELVRILDKHFRKFDKIIDNNNLEKIKTIGDAYMCVGGVPIRDKTNPIRTTLAAVQIKHYMLSHKAEQIEKGESYWQLRIGINTGSVSAGVIGTKRYAYDVWGSAVNRAQRMERFCKPGEITVSKDTFEYIEPYFECKPIGKIEMKTGLKIMTYEVICIKPELSVDSLGIEPNDSFRKLVELHHYSKINYYKAERFILNKLKVELDPKLHYHSFNHSKDVTRQVERIAIEEGITDEDLFLLKSAASYHDAGFVKQYDHNETIGAKMAEKILPEFGYTKEHIQRIKELIYVTEVPHKPKNILEEIICDADLDYLGRPDFHKISDRLRKELREHGKIDSDRKWDEMQVKFFNLHHYFTATAIRTRQNMKEKHLEEIKERLQKDEYKD